MSFKRGKTQIKGTLNVISALRPARTSQSAARHASPVRLRKQKHILWSKPYLRQAGEL